MLDDFEPLAGDPIRVPGNLTHLMWVRPLSRLVTVARRGEKLAETINPLRVIELGRRDICPPVIYVPKADVSASLRQNAERSFCPLKGHASYFNLIGPGGAPVAQDIAWAYEGAFDFAAQLKGHIAFDANQVEVTESPI